MGLRQPRFSDWNLVNRDSRSLRIVFVIWLLCYLAGPLVETFDDWDTPLEEMTDIATSAGGVLIWAAAGVCAAIALLREFCKHCRESAILSLKAPLLLLRFDLAFAPVSLPVPLFDASPLRL